MRLGLPPRRVAQRVELAIRAVRARVRLDRGLARGGRPPFLWSFWLMHVWLFVEMALAAKGGRFLPWALQFAATLWINTIMVVSSHDFTNVFEADSKDWARYQILNSHDMRITGNHYVDCFLSAGLAEQ